MAEKTLTELADEAVAALDALLNAIEDTEDEPAGTAPAHAMSNVRAAVVYVMSDMASLTRSVRAYTRLKEI